MRVTLPTSVVGKPAARIRLVAQPSRYRGDMVEAREVTPAPRRAEVVARRWAEHLWRVIVTTFGSCLRHRVTGLAAEAAFFAVLSVPPLVFALAGSIGFVSDRFTATQLDDIRNSVLEISPDLQAVDRVAATRIAVNVEAKRIRVVMADTLLQC